MMTKQAKKPTTPEGGKFPRKSVPVFAGKTEEDTCRNHATVTTSPELAAYRVINAAEAKSGMGEHIDVPTLLDTLRQQAAVVNGGDLAQAEAMLMNQATALQSLFARLTEKSMSAEYLPNFEAFMRMALRAQSQCRATLETLAAIKNPPIVYAKQANVTTGPQQINNGTAAPSHAQKTEIEQTQLMRADHGQWMDTGTAGAAIGRDPAMATVGAINRAEVGRE
jgi:hypothetical protein